MDGLTLPGDAFRQTDLTTLGGWNAYAHEQGRTAFRDAGISSIDPTEPITAYAAYVLGEPPDSESFGLAGVPDDLWLLVVCFVYETGKGWAGRVLEVRAGAFRSQPLSEPPPNVMKGLYDGGERFRLKRETQGLPIGMSLHGPTD